MISYLLVALGGAIGSVGRAVMADVMLRLTGPRFPWGTILINILGSCVIGVFSALALPGGRFTITSETRVFVMVGVCGGFTTFSSFSLQTLDLLRAGRPGSALANIGLSVVLCLVAVAVGYSVARAMSQGGIANP
jgi:CrcB protein